MSRFTKGRRIKHGAVSIVLTALVIVAAVIFNMILAALAGRYQWMYVDMNRSTVYSISGDCEDYISDYVIPRVDKVNSGKSGAEKERITLIFCDDRENIEADSDQKYIHRSVYELLELFPEHLEVEYLNVWEEPNLARAYGVNSTDDVVCLFNGKHETIDLADFFIYEAGNISSAVAYNGEMILAACLMRVTQEKTPMCYITANHGEVFEDYEFMRMLVESGYNVSYLDLSNQDIPNDCDILVTFDPKQDLVVSDGVSGISEVEKLDDYMNAGGKYMVFLSADTFVGGGHKNLEAFLAKWGVTYAHKTGDDGIEEPYLIKDPANSLTVDGYTVIAEKANSEIAEAALSGVNANNVFGNSGCIFLDDSFTASENGGYKALVDGRERQISPVLVSHLGAQAWAGGRAVERAEDSPFVLMSLSTQTCENGKTAYLLASSSIEFAKEEAMQSAVLGNSRALMSLIRYMGKDDVPADLVIKPFVGTEIESLTTADANLYTVILAAIPAVVLAVLGVVVIVRRRNS